jgi:hypothetical protein
MTKGIALPKTLKLRRPGDAAYAAAIAAGATDNRAPGARPYYDPRYYAANVLDPDRYSLEFVHKSWHHKALIDEDAAGLSSDLSTS